MVVAVGTDVVPVGRFARATARTPLRAYRPGRGRHGYGRDVVA
ncbi:hypothetical protein ABGB16_03590 [Micromonospora sp. B11E3]